MIATRFSQRLRNVTQTTERRIIMGLFNKNVNAAKPVKSPESTFAAARSNLLLVVGFTAVNLILTLVLGVIIGSAGMYQRNIASVF